MSYGLFGGFVSVDGKRDQLTEILIKAASMLEDNNDCIQYTVGKGEADNEVHVAEIWTSKQAHDASLEPEDIRNLIMAARPLICDMLPSTEFDVVGGKNI